MGIFDITYNLQTRRLLPPFKRLPNWLAWMTSLVAPIQWLSNWSITYYRTGIYGLNQYNSSATYAKGACVYGLDGSVYEALEDISSGYPLTGENWCKVLDTFVGAEERVLFNGQTVTLEYALNVFLGTQFIQPDFNDPLTRSDIYIDTLDTDDDSALIGATTPDTLFVGADSSLIDDWVTDDYSSNGVNFTVFYPSSLTTRQVERLMSYTEKYKLYGTTPNYVSYI